MAHIVSASRRTDIPAFFPEWLLRRVDAGWAASVNPFNRRAVRVSLSPADVIAFVLWSKDLSRFEDAAARLADAGYALYFQYTITGLPRALEPGVPPPEVTIPAAQRLAARFGRDAVQWRYDPVLLGGELDAAWHRENHARLAAALEGATTRCIVSFGTYYRKVTRALGSAGGVARALTPVEPAAAAALARELDEESARHGMALSACCTPELEGTSIRRAACVDAAHITNCHLRQLGRVPPRVKRPAPSRPGCGCDTSRDIGIYDTCPHGCVYCYANSPSGGSPGRAAANARRHDPSAPVLFGRLVEEEGVLRWRP